MNCVEKKQLSKSSFPSSSSSYFLGLRVTVSRYIKVTLLAFSDFRLAKASKLHLNTSYLQALFARVLLWLLLSFFAMFWHSTHFTHLDPFTCTVVIEEDFQVIKKKKEINSGDTIRIISACAWEMTHLPASQTGLWSLKHMGIYQTGRVWQYMLMSCIVGCVGSNILKLDPY